MGSPYRTPAEPPASPGDVVCVLKEWCMPEHVVASLEALASALREGGQRGSLAQALAPVADAMRRDGERGRKHWRDEAREQLAERLLVEWGPPDNTWTADGWACFVDAVAAAAVAMREPREAAE